MMPAGIYYVGDLCCILEYGDWIKACESTFIRDGTVVNGELTLPDGRRVAIYSTAYGDGTYFDAENNDYGVDSGTLGCILISDLKLDKPLEDLDGSEFRPNPYICGNVHEFKEEFATGQLGDGKIMFGHVVINTKMKDD